MAKRLAQRIGRRKSSHQVGEAEKIIPINHETAEIIAQLKKLFREQLGVARMFAAQGIDGDQGLHTRHACEQTA
jgi:hypothetical protein